MEDKICPLNPLAKGSESKFCSLEGLFREVIREFREMETLFRGSETEFCQLTPCRSETLRFAGERVGF